MSSTPGLLPIITEDTKVRTNVKTLIGVGLTLAGAVIWCTAVYLDVQGLKTSDAAKSAQLDAMARAMSDLRDEVHHLAWALERPSGTAGRGSP